MSGSLTAPELLERECSPSCGRKPMFLCARNSPELLSGWTPGTTSGGSKRTTPIRGFANWRGKRRRDLLRRRLGDDRSQDHRDARRQGFSHQRFEGFSESARRSVPRLRPLRSGRRRHRLGDAQAERAGIFDRQSLEIHVGRRLGSDLFRQRVRAAGRRAARHPMLGRTPFKGRRKYLPGFPWRGSINRQLETG